MRARAGGARRAASGLWLAASLLAAASASAQDRVLPPSGGLEAERVAPVAAAVTAAPGATLRVLDKIDGTLTDLDLAAGDTAEVGTLTVTLGECRYPSANPSGDAFALVSIRTASDETAVFEGWLIASAPALNAMDHPRYDVWALSCRGT